MSRSRRVQSKKIKPPLCCQPLPPVATRRNQTRATRAIRDPPMDGGVIFRQNGWFGCSREQRFESRFLQRRVMSHSAGCGRSVLREYDRRSMTEPPQQFLARLEANAIPRVPATAVFLTRLPPPNVL